MMSGRPNLDDSGRLLANKGRPRLLARPAFGLVSNGSLKIEDKGVLCFRTRRTDGLALNVSDGSPTTSEKKFDIDSRCE